MIALFIGCHPDDIELGCGGTVAFFASLGYEVVCVFLTKGEGSGDPQQRVQESISACGVHHAEAFETVKHLIEPPRR